MIEQRARRVPLLLPPREYEALQAAAQREMRTPTQQAAWIVHRALAVSVPQPTDNDTASGELAGGPDVPDQAA